MDNKSIEIKFEGKNKEKLVLIYNIEVSSGSIGNLHNEFREKNAIGIYSTYYFSLEQLIKEEIIESDVKSYKFLLGSLLENYYVIPGNIFKVENVIKLHKDLFSNSYFFRPRVGTVKVSKLFGNSHTRSIFRHIGKLVKEDIVIGGEEPSSIPIEDFIALRELFPTKTTKQHFVNARISNFLGEYFDTISDHEKKLIDHYTRQEKRSSNTALTNKSILSPSLYLNEGKKYEYIYSEMKDMLKNVDAYSESKWQSKIMEIILLLYPKYLFSFDEFEFKTNVNNRKKRIDIGIIDFNGHLDIIEIKRPGPSNGIITTYTTGRNNYIPIRDLSDAIMQIEKYLFHISRSAIKVEELLNKQYSNIFPQDFHIKITNPKGILIIGRDEELNEAQKLDFEVIRRKYSNIMDIVTYDDIIRRLKFQINRCQGISDKVCSIN